VAPLAAAAIGFGAPAASAAPGANCGAYPPGQMYGMRVSANNSKERAVRVPIGQTVSLAARVYRGGENCSGRRVALFVHGPGEFASNGEAAYHLSGYATTDAFGLARIDKTVINSFRWYFGYTSDNGTGVIDTRGADRLVLAIRS
jgi:hypothetical protein